MMKSKKIIIISICAVIGILFGGMLLGFSFSQGTKLSVEYELKKMEIKQKRIENEEDKIRDVKERAIIEKGIKYDKQLVFSDDIQLESMIKSIVYKQLEDTYNYYLDNITHYDDIMASYINTLKKTKSYEEKRYSMLYKCIDETCVVFISDASKYYES